MKVKIEDKYLNIGIDVGSTTVKIIVLDHNKNILYKNYMRHYSDIKKSIAELLETACSKFKEYDCTANMTGSGGLSISNYLKIHLIYFFPTGIFRTINP